MKKGTVKVSVLYPNTENAKFDFDYYTGTHLQLVGGLLGGALLGATAEKGLGGPTPGSAPEFIGMGNMYFNTIEDFQNAFGPNAEKIMGDLPNFTNIQPVIQISEVLA
tara:strand:+ start:264 stop:587 length:324 start_codon:yes stop_codon:yes gene_type:complete